MMRRILGILVLVCSLPAEAAAFCGFYVSGADASLFNDATQVVLMREGTRTVLSMQNAYKGPPQDFAMVVPVPVVLKEADVKTLPHDLFKKVDLLDAPRLVEYWEQDPCGGFGSGYGRGGPGKRAMAKDDDGATATPRDHGVTIEAQFTVGEYEIVVLSAKDSTGLDTWLREKQYKIPAGAEPFLRPYVQSGMKFFVAKVNIKKVKVVAGRAVLSPLRMHYDSEEFVLPIRLGLANSSGTQDLIVHILAPETRYEAANYDNVTIPTNLDVAESARDQFGAFYAALFDRTVATHPLALVTEYAWDASSCDPCPLPPLEPGELATLGGDVIESGAEASFVLTRLHLRYPKDFRGDDLVFRKAYPIAGGREMEAEDGRIERRARPDEWNNFQARYVIRHPWTAPVTCADPQRGIWGPPPPKPGQEDDYDPWTAQKPVAASDLAYAARGGVALGMMIAEDVPEIGVKKGDATLGPPTLGSVPEVHKRSGCGCQTTGSEQIVGVAFICLVALFACHRRR